MERLSNSKIKNILIITVDLLIILFLCFYAISSMAQTAYVNASALNVREGTGTNTKIVGVLYRGQAVETIDEFNGWTLIQYGEDVKYVFTKYLTYTTEESVNDEPKKRYLGTYYVTGYDPYCSHCCGGLGNTASGVKAVNGITVAMKNVPFGTKVYIEGIGERIVQDRGGFKSNVIDIACDGHSACYEVTGWRNVYIIE